MVFAMKYLRGVLNADMLQRCNDAMQKVCADFGAELRGFKEEDDHVHLLVDYPPKNAVAGLANTLKGMPGGCDWSSPTG